MKALGMALLFSVTIIWGQQFPTMPEPLPQVEYIGALPSWEVRAYQVSGGTVSESPHISVDTGSASRGRMIILNEVELELENDARPQPEASGPTVFYLKDNIWNETRRFLEKYMPPPARDKNRVTLDMAREIAKLNKVRVLVWKLDGHILDTKMPKGYKLVNPFSVVEIK